MGGWGGVEGGISNTDIEKLQLLTGAPGCRNYHSCQSQAHVLQLLRIIDNADLLWLAAVWSSDSCASGTPSLSSCPPPVHLQAAAVDSQVPPLLMMQQQQLHITAPAARCDHPWFR